MQHVTITQFKANRQKDNRAGDAFSVIVPTPIRVRHIKGIMNFVSRFVVDFAISFLVDSDSTCFC